MIDFTSMQKTKKTYSGANGAKIGVLYQEEKYMLKFPGTAKFNKEMSYANGCVSEYIGCHIFEIIGIPVQKTILGTYLKGEKEKLVVACKDFTDKYTVLQDFASVKNTIVDSLSGGYDTTLFDVINTIEEQSFISSEKLKEWFWDMFIVDALIGNWDRHNGNWGFLYNAEKDQVEIAPIYDCGSCLYPQADEKLMKEILEDRDAMMYRVFEIPLSALKEDGKKINYYDFISSLKNEDCNRALERIIPKIDMEKINCMIDEIPYLSDISKIFYKTILEERKKIILDKSLEKLESENKSLQEYLEENFQEYEEEFSMIIRDARDYMREHKVSACDAVEEVMENNYVKSKSR